MQRKPAKTATRPRPPIAAFHSAPRLRHRITAKSSKLHSPKISLKKIASAYLPMQTEKLFIVQMQTH